MKSNINNAFASLVLASALMWAGGCGERNASTPENPEPSGSGEVTTLISTQPEDTVVWVGSNTVFSVGSSKREATYQWQFNGVDLPYHSDSITITNADTANVGLYTCVVTSGKERQTSQTAGLFLALTNPFGILSAVQGPFKPGSSSVTCDGHPITVTGCVGVTNLASGNVWFTVPANKVGCTIDTFDTANTPCDTVVTAKLFGGNTLCNDDAATLPAGYATFTHLSQKTFAVTQNQRWAFTIYVKGPPTPQKGYKMTLNVTWDPPN